MSLENSVKTAKSVINNLDPYLIKEGPFSNYYHDNIRIRCFTDPILNYEKISDNQEKQRDYIEQVYQHDKKACHKFMNHIKAEFILRIQQTNEGVLNSLEDLNFRSSIDKSKEFHDMIMSIYWWNLEIEQTQN